MKKISLIVFILLIFSCGGNVNTDYNGITIETKSKFQDYKNKEIIIYSNISESAIQEYKTKKFVSRENMQAFSNEIKCKDINPNYTSATRLNSYSYNGFYACYNYDMSKTDYSGSKTYIITVGDFEEDSGNTFPSFNASFKALFTKERIKIPAIFKNKYDINEINKNNSYIWIFRNVNAQGLSRLLKSRKDTFIYKLPKDETITCEKMGFTPDDNADGDRLKTYSMKYIVNNEETIRRCVVSEILESDNSPEYGNDTYIIVEYPK